MSKAGFAQLQDVLLDADFPDLDLALRRGRHVDRDDAAWYTLCLDAQEHLEAFYQRYGCELIHKTDGYFYLLPIGDKLSRRQLAPGDMLVGQALALLYLDPAAIERGGVVSHDELIAQLSAVLGSDALIGAFNPKRKRHDERVAHKNVRSKVAEAVRRLAGLGFVELCAEDRLRLRPALLRFAEPVRGLSEPAEALAKLAAQGEVMLEPDLSAADGGEESDEGESAGEDEFAVRSEADGPLEEAESADEAAPAVRSEADEPPEEVESAAEDAHFAQLEAASSERLEDAGEAEFVARSEPDGAEHLEDALNAPEFADADGGDDAELEADGLDPHDDVPGVSG